MAAVNGPLPDPVCSPPPPLPPGAGVPRPLLARWEDAQDDTQRAYALNALARYVQLSSWEAARQLVEGALELALRAGSADAAVEALTDLAIICTETSAQVLALEHVAHALRLVKEHALTQRHPGVINARALTRLTAGDEVGARRDLTLALRLARAAGAGHTAAFALVNLAWLASVSGQPELALHQLSLLEEQLVTLERHLQHEMWPFVHEGRAHAYVVLARQARERGRAQAEAEAVRRGLQSIIACHAALVDSPDRTVLMLCESHHSRLKLLAGEVQAAAHHAYASLNHAEALKYVSYPEPYLALAEVHLARHNWEAAQPAFRRALEVGRQHGRFRENQRMLDMMAQWQERAGDLAAALATTREALEEGRLFMDRLAEAEARMEELDAEPTLTDDGAHSWQERLRLAEQQAREDILTGLLNRRGLEEGLRRLSAAAGSPDQPAPPLLVAFVDIDHFKRVNDLLSHALGDQALRTTAQLLAATLPAGSLLGRYGGEEFVVALPLPPDEPDPAGAAHALLDTCRAAVARHAWESLLPGMTLTISIGYALGHPSGLDGHLKVADEHLYQAKRRGRNQVYPPVAADAGPAASHN
ncbi:hypothetical protein GCM10010841_17910 [Deinococcus aerophilus]|uniref:GGDEF domain-containing protein n=1 Tax=Deinococcus aerophilus TaxID=522488 RepID=A0ABQ2GSK1_9DEIO|nr:hypothetical protein GCM10010841_17910 [Deinococcus aerophilus]